MRYFRELLFLLFAGLLVPQPALAIDLFKDSLPQALTNTCQSYAMMLALASAGDQNFPIGTFGELRNAELAFRAIAEATPGGPYGHDALKQAIDQFTGGRFELKIEGKPDIVSWMQRLKALTTLRGTADLLIAQLTGTSFPVVMTSVTSMGSNNYPSGHIVSVLGVAGSGLDSNTDLVAFNSAIKGNSVIKRCDAGEMPGDLHYTAGVVATNNYTLKQYGGAYRLLYLVRK